MTRDARIGEITAELQRMDDTLRNCDWCCGGGDERYRALLDELRELEGHYVQLIEEDDGTRTPRVKYDFRRKD